jgi:heterogeneous nuclear ribonucleoprotein U-like protein 1
MAQCLYLLYDLLQDLDGDDVTLAFAVNGEMQGTAYSITHSELQDRALFPHILSKNTKFKCNFGAEKPWFPPPEGYTFVAHVTLDERVSGAKRPEKREDCEVHFKCILGVMYLCLNSRVFDNMYFFLVLQIIMMCGLPGSGKTVWANEYYAKHLDKKYNILGTNNLIDKMKVRLFQF